MNYDDMPAGSEMDFLVATKFLGQEIPEVSAPDAWGWMKTHDHRWEKLEPLFDDCGGYQGVHAEARWPHFYSTNMFLLTELLKKLVSDEYEVYIKISSDGSVECDIVQEESLVHCEQLGEYPGWGVVAYGLAETVDEIPLAVCRAALKLVEGKGHG